MTIVMSLVGVVVLIGMAVALSDDRRRINWRTVGLAFALQAGIAALILYLPAGREMLNGLVRAVQSVIDFGDVGIRFVFGDMADKRNGFSIALHVLPIIVFFSALMSTLYYLGIM